MPGEFVTSSNETCSCSINIREDVCINENNNKKIVYEADDRLYN